MLRVNLMFNYFQIIYIHIASREYNLKYNSNYNIKHKYLF
jgi:hypothetical protein